jgi:hypothetical protein
MGEESNIFNWTLEGVTAQYAGEVLLDVPDTRSVRNECRHSYIACLDDWFFAIIYADSIEVAPPGMVGDSRPGHDLINLFSEVVTIVPPKSECLPEQLLEDMEFRAIVGNDLQRLNSSIVGAERYWRQWITRETEAFFGNDSSVFEAGKFGQYRFKKKPPLMFDKDLVDQIPEHSITLLCSAVQQHMQNHYWKPPHSDAVREFVLCNLLTLLTISRWYDASASLSGAIRLPSLVRSLSYQSARVGSLNSYLQEVRTITSQNALGKILETRPASRPEQLMQRAYDLRDNKKIIEVRRLLSDLFQELGVGHGEHVTKLVCDIGKLSQQESRDSESLAPMRIEREWLPIVKGVKGAIHGAIHRVENELLGLHTPAYLSSIQHLFPELFGNPPNKTIIIGEMTHQKVIMENQINKFGSHNNQINQFGSRNNFAGDQFTGDKIDTQINNSQDLAQASKDIKALLNQLSVDYPDDSPRVLGAKAVDQVEKNPELRSRILRGIKVGSFAALEKMIDHPVAKFFIEGAKEVLKP